MVQRIVQLNSDLKGEKELKDTLQLLRIKPVQTFYAIAVSKFSAMHFFYFTGYSRKQSSDITYSHMGMLPTQYTQLKPEKIVPKFPNKASGTLYTL